MQRPKRSLGIQSPVAQDLCMLGEYDDGNTERLASEGI